MLHSSAIVNVLDRKHTDLALQIQKVKQKHSFGRVKTTRSSAKTAISPDKPHYITGLSGEYGFLRTNITQLHKGWKKLFPRIFLQKAFRR
jgi:hypothetical protein